jgi:hypothetical protein
MTRALTKMLLVMLGLLGMTSSFGQDITLKKLYDGIEDMRLEVGQPNMLRQNSALNPLKKETGFLKRTIQNQFKSCSPAGIDDKPYQPDISARKVMTGSFTKRGLSQNLYLTYFACELDGDGISIMEGKKSIAFYESEHIYAAFSVSDINQNGLNELMLVMQARAKAPWDEMLAVQLLEFPNAKPVSLGSFFIGGPVDSWDDLPPEYITCSPQAPKELQKFFPSNIIYVQKGKIPQFFAEGWEVNCDYLEKGVKARKVSSLTPIKPVPRAVGLTRLF